MNGWAHFWHEGDAVTKSVALLLLLMSVGTWVVIVWKGWVLWRVRQDMGKGIPAFWAGADLSSAVSDLSRQDRENTLMPLAQAVRHQATAGTLEAQGHLASQLTRRLRDALQGVLRRLRWGQVWLASVGSLAPFVGLFGTVWGIYHALIKIATEGSVSIDKVSGPVGEALIMTAFGLAVAIPAVLAYNLFNKQVATCEADLEGFAHDLREVAIDPPRKA